MMEFEGWDFKTILLQRHNLFHPKLCLTRSLELKRLIGMQSSEFYKLFQLYGQGYFPVM